MSSGVCHFIPDSVTPPIEELSYISSLTVDQRLSHMTPSLYISRVGINCQGHAKWVHTAGKTRFCVPWRPRSRLVCQHSDQWRQWLSVPAGVRRHLNPGCESSRLTATNGLFARGWSFTPNITGAALLLHSLCVCYCAGKDFSLGGKLILNSLDIYVLQIVLTSLLICSL